MGHGATNGLTSSSIGLAFFTDAVFAIAMTLLIVTVQPPRLEGPIDAPGTLLGAMTELLPQPLTPVILFLVSIPIAF